MKDAFRKAAAAAAHAAPPALRQAQVNELGKIVQRRQADRDALRARAEHSPVRPFELQQREHALAAAIAARDAATKPAARNR